jgi:hypothetical protein
LGVLLLLDGVLVLHRLQYMLPLLLLLQRVLLLLFFRCEYGLRKCHVIVQVWAWLLTSCYLLPPVHKPQFQQVRQDPALPISRHCLKLVSQTAKRALLHHSTLLPLLLQRWLLLMVLQALLLLLQLCVCRSAKHPAKRCTARQMRSLLLLECWHMLCILALCGDHEGLLCCC